VSAATLVIVLGVLTPAFGFFVTATVLPSVIADVGGLAFYAWASTAYSVASILGSATSAVIVRKTATRTALLVASAIFVAGTIACALAPSMLVLVAGRALQGFGGGMMIAAVHGVVRDVFPEALWPRMLAMISVAWGVAAMSGPAIGGTFASLGVWRGAFWIIVPLTVVAAALTWRIVPHAPAHAKGSASRVPLGRLALLCVGVLCVASVANVASTIVRVALVLAALGAIALVLRLDARARERLFPADMLSLSRPMGKAFGMIFFLAMCTTPGSVYIPLLLQILQGFAPATAGYFYAAQSLAWTFAALVVTRLATQPRLGAPSGSAASAASRSASLNSGSSRFPAR
jgi:MFS family permease